jgi:molybdate transport system substrate-binding protein
MLLVVSLFLASCGDDAGGRARLTVYAASSLTDVFPTIDPAARYDFAGSDELAARIRAGAPADVYAAASSKYAHELYRAGLLEKPLTFASNRLVLIVPADDPARIERARDVAKPGTKLVIGASGVPVGDYTRELLRRLHLAGALANVVSDEADAKGVVAKVAAGEADAGFVYATDASVANGVRAIALPPGSQPQIAYQVAVVAASRDKRAAEAFVRKVLGRSGRRSLTAAGFVLPRSVG